MQKLVNVSLNLMFYKGYFGYSKTEMFAQITQTYSLKNTKVPTYLLEARKSGAHTFYEKEVKDLINLLNIRFEKICPATRILSGLK